MEVLPEARKSDLVEEKIGNEIVVYDSNSRQAHRLNPSCAFVWRHCDGQRDIGQLSELLSTELEISETEELVRLALDQLCEAGLLKDAVVSPVEPTLDRRSVLGRLSLASAVSMLVLPTVITLATPTPAQAQSGGGGGAGGGGGDGGADSSDGGDAG